MRLLIADNQRLMLRVLRVSLEEAEGFEIVGEVMSANQLLPRIAEVSPDLVLLDAR